MLRELVKMASKLDALGLTKEADTIDALIEKMAGTWSRKGVGVRGKGDIEDAPMMSLKRIHSQPPMKSEWLTGESSLPESSPESLELDYSAFDWNLDPSSWDSLQWEAWPNKLAEINAAETMK